MYRIDVNNNGKIPAWQRELKDCLKDPLELFRFIELDIEKINFSPDAAHQFPLKVTRSFAERIIKGDYHDPLLRQVLPLTDELILKPGYSGDPVGDLKAVQTPGLLHKYQGRVLLINTGACAIHCRYCFRREFPYSREQFGLKHEDDGISYIQSNPSIREVILSGGDPLILNDDRLQNLIDKIEAIDHVIRLRIHSRVPVVLPSRLTPALLKSLSGTRLRIVMVVHVNHPNEIDESVRTTASKLSKAGVSMFNQSVLLKGVNDDSEVLSELSEKLFATGITPYYIHMLDKVAGTAHYDVSNEQAIRIQQELQENLPGYLAPKMVREIKGEPYKTPI